MDKDEECLRGEAVVGKDAVANSTKYLLHDTTNPRRRLRVQNLDSGRGAGEDGNVRSGCFQGGRTCFPVMLEV